MAWDKVDANADGKSGRGEVGEGWSCGWETLVGNAASKDMEQVAVSREDTTDSKSQDDVEAKVVKTGEGLPHAPPPIPKPAMLHQLSSSQALKLLKGPSPGKPDACGTLMTVQITLLTRGVSQTCARIYRLPSSTTHAALRKEWLDLVPQKGQHVGVKRRQSALPTKLHLTDEERQRQLARQLLHGDMPGAEKKHPACPPAEDLIGFVTSGNFNLAEGRGTGIGSLAVWKVLNDSATDAQQRRLCVVRNAGEDVARLARWNVV